MKSKYDDLKWHYETIPSGGSFTVPPRKLYEVYAHSVLGAISLKDEFALCATVGNTNVAPFFVSVAYDSADVLILARCASPHGWILSEGETLITAAGSTMRIRWRDVTALYCDEL